MVGIALLLLLASIAVAQSGGGYDLSWNTVDGGGATFNTAGEYALGGTAGQTDAGVLAAGEYTLSGGFWRGGALPPAPKEIELYLPLVLRGSG
jgi:hypothetical protein